MSKWNNLIQTRLARLVVVGIAVLIAATLLAGFDPVGAPFSGWFAYLVLLVLGVGIFWVCLRLVGQGSVPRSVLLAMGVALLLRLVVGVALQTLLPVYGYDRSHQEAGYLFPDAYYRDLDAWGLANSGQPLTRAFTSPETTDQYGGLMFSSAMIHRYLSPQAHRPLLIVVPAAFASSLAVLFIWAFTASLFGASAALLAGWIAALYPESILLGATQMREPFMAMGLAIALYGYVRLREGDNRVGGLLILGGVLPAILLSPPFGILALGIIIGAWIWEGRYNSGQTAWVLGGLAVLVLITFVLTIAAWSRIADWGETKVIPLLNWWLIAGARYEMGQLEQASGWVQNLFDRTPAWAHLPMATGYGLVQPFLPAALMDNTGSVLFRLIASWRALGWFLLLPLLLYAPFRAIRNRDWRNLTLYFSLVIWGAAILVSFRSAGNMWETPRYRVFFLALQAALAGWAYFEARTAEDPWLRRIAVIVAGATLIFLQWYAGRYYYFPRLSLFGTLQVIGGFVLVVLLSSIGLDMLRARRHGLTGELPKV